MSIAFRAPVTSTQKLVLLALCDSANDSGECYPSIPTLMTKCSLSDRGVQRAVAELEQLGQLRRELRHGRSTVYWMTPSETLNPRTSVTPERQSPPTHRHPTPERQSPRPPNVSHPTPERQSPITINEPSVEPSRNHQKRVKAQRPALVEVRVLVAAGFAESVAAEFIAHKSAKKAPLTERAWLDHVREAEAAGWTAQQAAEKTMARNWAGFEARYVAGQNAPNPQQSFATRNAEAKRLLGIKPTGDFIDA